MPSITVAVSETAVFTGISNRYVVGVMVLSTAMMLGVANPAIAGNEIESAAFTDSATVKVVAQIAETAHFLDSSGSNFSHRIAAKDSALFTDSAKVFLRAADAETATFSGTAKTGQATSASERATFVDAATPFFTYQNAVVETAQLRDAVTGFIKLTASDSVAFAGTANSSLGLRKTVAESAAFSDRATPSLRAVQIVRDTAAFTDSATVRTSYRVSADEIASFAGVARITLSGVAWTASTDSFAMSRYAQFPFNSAARIGNQLIAAGDGGLYVIAETNDNGEPIAASLTTGLTDVGDPQQKRVREIFLGYEASGAMGVDVAITQSGAEQTYGYTFPAKTATDPTANRQKVGRGIKSRFWRFIIHNVAGARFRVTETRVDVEPTSRKI